MARDTVQLSVATLERLLDKRKSRLEKLSRERATLQNKLDRIHSQIAALEGRKPGEIGSKPGGRRRKRPKNAMSLHETVLEVLKKSKQGYSLAALEQKVKSVGYKTKSSNFKNVLYQCLYKSPEFEHDAESGRYRLKS